VPQDARPYAKQYERTWKKFTRLALTQDSLADGRFLRRWLRLPYIAFLIPIDDPAVVDQLTEWQAAFQPWLAYDAQPAERLHITLHYVGLLRRSPWMLLPHTWQRSALSGLADRAREPIELCAAFEIGFGPLNAFPNALIAEVQDTNRCLQRLRARVRRALPLRARPPSPWNYLPHVTLGYWGKQDAAPLIERLRPFRAVEPQTMRVDRVKLTVYTRDMIAPQRDILTTTEEDVIAQFSLQG